MCPGRAATGAVAATGTGAEPATDEVVWVIGMLCKVKFGTGDRFWRSTARVTGDLAKHCHVEFLEGPRCGERQKIHKENLTPWQAEAPAGDATNGAEAPAEEAPTQNDTLTDTQAAWEDAGNVF